MTEFVSFTFVDVSNLLYLLVHPIFTEVRTSDLTDRSPCPQSLASNDDERLPTTSEDRLTSGFDDLAIERKAATGNPMQKFSDEAKSLLLETNHARNFFVQKYVY